MPSNERAEYIAHSYGEKSQKLWSYYVSEATQRDKHLTENWKGNMDSTLIFAGLFSAVVSAFIIESYKLLKEDSSDITNVLLTQILAIQVATLPSNSSSPPVIPTVASSMGFTPSTGAITVNILWFLSLVCSLTAALMMILIQQWIRDYLQRIERSSDPLRRARDRIFLSNGMERWRMDIVVHYIPTLLHISLFLFFAGLYIFLAPINRTVTLAVIPIFLCCAVLYGLITVAPLIDLSSPYETSFSSLCWRILQYVSQIMRRERWWHVSPYLQTARNQLALNPWRGSGETDAGALVWLYNQISNDKELERFLESLPEFLDTPGGYETLSLAAHNERNDTFIQPLFIKLISLAKKPSNSTLGQRAVACIEALTPIIIEGSPKLLRRCLTYVGSLHTASISDTETMAMICFRALALYHGHFSSISSKRMKRIVRRIPETSMLPINVIEDARRALEDIVASVDADIPHLDDIQDLVHIYCATLESKSMELRRWADSLEDAEMYIRYGQHFSSSLRWFSELNYPRGVEFSCDTPTMVPEVNWVEVFHGPRLLAFMRATGVLQPLHPIPESSLTSHCQPSPEPDISSNGGLQTHFLREIHPLLMLLDLVGEKRQAWVTWEPSKYDKVLQLVLRAFGPFDTIRFTFDDQSLGSRVIALLELVIHLRQRPDLVVKDSGSPFPRQTSTFRKTVNGLEIIERDHLDNLSSACSEHLFVGVLYALLTLEREAMSNSKPFVLPGSEMEHLISFIQYFKDSDALQIAKNLLPTISTISMVSTIQDNHPVSHPPPDLQQTRGRWKALHDRIAEERLSVLAETEVIPSS